MKFRHKVLSAAVVVPIVMAGPAMAEEPIPTDPPVTPIDPVDPAPTEPPAEPVPAETPAAQIVPAEATTPWRRTRCRPSPRPPSGSPSAPRARA